MQTLNKDLFTPTEAAALTRLPLKAVNNAIDKKTVTSVTWRGASNRGGRQPRRLNTHALVYLLIAQRLPFLSEFRRELFEALAAGPRNVVSLKGGLLKIDLREPRRELAAKVHALRQARRLVISDPEIMGGDPVFRGTRIPVHRIAELRAQGASEAELLSDYRLSPEMIYLAQLYAEAYPLRGRPRKQPWHDRPPLHQSRRKLSTIGVS